MIKKILLVLATLFAILLATPLFTAKSFRVERSLSIAAKPEVLFDYFNNHKKFNEWNPWLKMDPGAKVSYTGPEAGLGAISAWEGDVTGKGSATITESKPGELVRERMDWIEPMAGVSTVDFTFKADGEKTNVTWAMYGDNGYMGRLMCLFMSMDKMCGDQFAKGLKDLSDLIAKPNP